MSKLNFIFHQLLDDEFELENLENRNYSSYEDPFRRNFPFDSIKNVPFYFIKNVPFDSINIDEDYDEFSDNSPLVFKIDKNNISSTKGTRMSKQNFIFHRLLDDEFEHENLENRNYSSYEDPFRRNFPFDPIKNVPFDPIKNVPFDPIKNLPFDSINIDEDDDEFSDNPHLLFKNDKNNISSTKGTTTDIEKIEGIKKKKNPFNVEKEVDNNFLGKKTNFGRKKKLEEKEINENSSAKTKKTHDKKELSNILNKVEVDCHNSIPEFLNSFLDFVGHDKKERFLKINPIYKKRVNKDFLDRKKNTKLYEIICLDISDDYTNYPLDHNKNLYENLKKIAKEKPIYQILLNFLDENYLFYFQNVYYKNERTINLQKYGIDAILPLSEKVGLFNDKFRSESFEDKELSYLNKVKESINLCYFDSKLILFKSEKQK